MTVIKNSEFEIAVFLIALVFTVFIVFRLHLFEPVLKHHYNHRKKEGRKKRETLYGFYNRRKK